MAAAEAFLATLDQGQRLKANIDLNEKTRTVWSNLPTRHRRCRSGATERNGLKLGDMTPAQEKAALALVAADAQPRRLPESHGHRRRRPGARAAERSDAPGQLAGSASDALSTTSAILGKPSTTDPWMIQFGGHHLAINVTLAGRENVLTPTHTGAQPASYSVDGRTVRPLGDENDKAFALINALNADQQKQAILGYEVRNLVLGPGDRRQDDRAGRRARIDLHAAQRAMLVDLVREWVDILGDEAAAAKMKEVQAGLADTYFAWAGATTNGKGAYFRIQGPTVVIEYAPQGRRTHNTDHIHTIYRDPTNDYAAKGGSDDENGSLLAPSSSSLAMPAESAAHRLDEYLQAARVSLARDRIALEVDLTPGANIAPAIVALLDRDGDGTISPIEAEAYGQVCLERPCAGARRSARRNDADSCGSSVD